MTYWTAILLGIVQGLAEFLPISSSGHLAILQNFLRIGNLENQMLFDVLLHLGTLGAVIIAYHTELRGLCREGLMMLHLKKPKRGARQDPPRRRLLLFLIVATLPLIPAAFLNDYLDPLFYDTFFIGFALIATGFLLLAADRFGHGNKTEKAMTLSDALMIGLAQMIAVVPGLSRSGTTISAGMLRGFDRTFAVKFSFFLSIPAVLGANLLSLVKAIVRRNQLAGGSDVSVRRCCRVCLRISCHFRAQPHCAAREIRWLLLLLLGRRSVDADSVPDLVRCYGSMASTNKRKSTASRGRKKTAKKQAAPIRREIGAGVCAVFALLSVLCCFKMNAAFLNLLTSVFRGLIGAGFYILPFSFIMSFLILFLHDGRPVALRVTCTFLTAALIGSLVQLVGGKFDASGDWSVIAATLGRRYRRNGRRRAGGRICKPA